MLGAPSLKRPIKRKITAQFTCVYAKIIRNGGLSKLNNKLVKFGKAFLGNFYSKNELSTPSSLRNFDSGPSNEDRSVRPDP